MTQHPASVTVLMRPPAQARHLEAYLRPLLEDPATAEVLLFGPSATRPLESTADGGRVHPVRSAQEAIRVGRGDVILVMDQDVLASAGLVTGHAERHVGNRGLLVVGYAPIEVTHERSPADFGGRLRAKHYGDRCEAFDREPASVLMELWAGSVSFDRSDALALDAGALLARHPREADRRLGKAWGSAGHRGVFDRAVEARRFYPRSVSAFCAEARAEGGGTGPTRERSRASLLKAAIAAFGTAHAWGAQDACARRLWELERNAGRD